MFRIFKEFASYMDSYQGDMSALLLNLIGGFLIGITFLVIGIIYIYLSQKDKASKRRKRVLTLFGLFLISCSFSRFISILSTWHNYAILDGWIKIITGLLAFFAIVYIPNTIKEAMAEKRLEETHELLEKTQQSIEDIKELSRKITNK
jgi:multisubunit Na+/H+ antiporter MnhB subunit